MPPELNYIVMLAAFGAVSGLDVLDRREFSGIHLSEVNRFLGGILGVADIVLYGVAFFVFPLGSAVAVIITATMLSVIGAKLPPPPTRIWFSYGWTFVGAMSGATFLLVR